jgi:dipeptidyl aminopeptidase/acylaminoacyl peptidase
VRQDGQLFARPFDARKVRFAGDPRAIAKDVSTRAFAGPSIAYSRGVTDLAVSETGTVLFTDGWFDFSVISGNGFRRSIAVQSAAKTTWIKVPQLGYRDLRASPDGARLALTIQDSTNTSRDDVYILTFATGQLSRFTRDGMSSRPVWSPDGKRIIYRVTNPGAKPVLRFYSRPWDESEPASPLPSADGAEAVEFPGPSGKYLAYVRGDSGATESQSTNSDILIAPIDSPAAARPFAASGLRERMPRFSPNGKWLAYIGHELPSTSGTTTQQAILYVRPVPGPGAVTQVSISAGNTPLWSRDGRTLSYFAGGGPAPLIAAHVSESRGFEVISRDEVFGRSPPGTGFAAPIAPTLADILPTGEVVYLTNRTQTAIPSGGAPTFSSKIIAIVNWLGEGRSAPSR